MQKICCSSIGLGEMKTFAKTKEEQTVYQMFQCMRKYSPETFEHSFSVAQLSGKLGAVLGYAAEDVLRLNLAGMLHDVGKLTIPLEILHKKGALNAAEWEVMKRHPDAGYRLLLPYITDTEILLTVRQHHERLDGTGYPDKLTDGIIDFAKIVMLADVFDGLTRKRAYRAKPIGISDTKAIMAAERERYDQTYLQAFLNGVV